MKRISFIFGTRPEAIKLCPLILAMKNNPCFEPNVCVTGQHREMLDQVLEVFDVKPDIDLKLMQANQTLAGLTSKAITAVDSYLQDYNPDMIIVQGDTTTVLAASLAAFYRKIKIGHVEAGLRTWNKFSPFPEEINRVMTTKIADYHFAPTETSKNNLLKDGVDIKHIFVTGNTVIDALYWVVDKVKDRKVNDFEELKDLCFNGKMILITGHRRENFGQGFLNMCNAMKYIAEKNPDITLVYPVHLNPNVKEPVYNILGNTKNIKLIKPLSYLPFVWLMNKSYLVLTDSGGVQEEAPSLGKPVLVMRDTTERPEAIDAGTVKLVGTDYDLIVNSVETLLNNNQEYNKMAKSINPYGDGKSVNRILSVCSNS